MESLEACDLAHLTKAVTETKPCLKQNAMLPLTHKVVLYPSPHVPPHVHHAQHIHMCEYIDK